MTAPNLAVVNIATSAVSTIAPAKTLDDLQAELRILEAELKSNQVLINERATRSYAVQSATSGLLLGHRTQADLAEATRKLEESVNAIPRKALLEQAIAEKKQSITLVQQRERAEYVASIKSRYYDVMDRYRTESQKLLAIHESLVAIDREYRALAPAYDGLLDPFYMELNLPALTGSLASRSGFCTGSGQ